MKYTILRTDKADEDLRGIINYIADSSESVEVALKYLSEFEQKIKSIENMPNKGSNPKYKQLKYQGYKFTTLGVYLIFYKINETTSTITICRILSGKQEYFNLIE